MVTSLFGQLERMLERLTQPSPYIINSAHRQRAKVLAGLCLALIPLFLIQNIIMLNNSSNSSLMMLFWFVSGIIVLTYVLSRTRYEQIGATLLIVTITLVCFYAASIQTTLFNLINSFQWLILVVVLAGLIVSTRWVIILSAFFVTVLICVGIQTPTLFEMGLMRSIGLLVSCGVLSAVYARIFQRNMQQVEERSFALEQLNTELEARVQERTAAWEVANEQLEAEIRERERTEAAVRQAQRLESLGLMASSIAHDLGNYLSSIHLNASHTKYLLDSTHKAQKNVERVLSSADLATELRNQLLAYAHNRPAIIEPICLQVELNTVAVLLQNVVPPHVQLHYEMADNLYINGDKTQMRQVMVNLVTNAGQAITSQSGNVWITAECCTLAHNDDRLFVGNDFAVDSDYICVSIRDDGCGMDADTLERIFDPFFTTKEQGNGLGLWSVIGIVRAHHGLIDVTSQPDEGTAFTLFFPALPQVMTPVAPPEEEIGDQDETTRVVLVVDDEEQVRETVVDILEGSGYRVLAADNGQAGVLVYQGAQDEIAVVIMDLQMPIMDGNEAAQAIRALNSTIPIIISSGYDDQEPFYDRHSSFLHKPYTATQLLTIVDGMSAVSA